MRKLREKTPVLSLVNVFSVKTFVNFFRKELHNESLANRLAKSSCASCWLISVKNINDCEND